MKTQGDRSFASPCRNDAAALKRRLDENPRPGCWSRVSGTPSMSCVPSATSAPLARGCASIASRSRTRTLCMACWVRDPKQPVPDSDLANTAGPAS
jgi:hypothetical protein